MSWRAFLYAADALRLEEGVSFQLEAAPGFAVPSVPSPAAQREQNARSMQMLQGMMAGVKGAPKVAGR